MKIIQPSFELIDPLDESTAYDIVRKLERIGRTAYKSEDKITETSASAFVKRIVQDLHHESVIEHVSVSVLIVCDRGVSHEIVRHRLASFTQESTRYCNYAGDKFGRNLTFIQPLFFEEGTDAYDSWEASMEGAEAGYLDMIDAGCKPQEARSVLPNSLKTEIVVTANLREWRHIFKLRCSKAAHPQMREIMIPLLYKFNEALPEIFGDIASDISEA